MVGFVIDNQDISQSHEIGHDSLKHLAFGFEGVQVLAEASFQEGAPAGGELHPLPPLKGVVVGYDDLSALYFFEHLVGNELAACVIAIRIVGLKEA